MSNNRVVVRRNSDETTLNKLFGSQIVAAAQSSHLVGKEMFKDEPWDYIPPAGISTRRGSRAVNTMEGSPFGSPSEIVTREIMRNPELRTADLKDIRPLAITQVNPNNIINKVGDFGPGVPPPTQADSIPDEYKELMNKTKKMEVATTEALPEQPAYKGGPTMMTSKVAHPRSFIDEDIPSGAKPDMMRPPAPGHTLPPATPEQPRKITEDMIVKVAGYNETNMYLLTEVSKNVAYCGKVIAKLNNAAKPVDMNEVMSLLAYMDNQEFRKVLVGTFNTILTNNMQLSSLITKYLNGELPAEGEEEEPTNEQPTNNEESTSEAQEQPGQSVSPNDSNDDGNVDTNVP